MQSSVYEPGKCTFDEQQSVYVVSKYQPINDLINYKGKSSFIAKKSGRDHLMTEYQTNSN